MQAQSLSSVEFISAGFHDCSLHFRVNISGHGMGHVRACFEAAGGYNGFDPERVGDVVERFHGALGGIEFGREFSPVMYVTIPHWTHQANGSGHVGMGDKIPEAERVALAREFMAAMQSEGAADEVSFDTPGGHVWFPAGLPAGDVVYNLRFWWD